MSYSTTQITKRVIHYVKPFWGNLIFLFVLNLLATPFALLLPLPLTYLIDSGFSDRPLPVFIRFFFENGHVFTFNEVAIIVTVFGLIIALFYNLYTLLHWMATTSTGEKIVMNFRAILFNHIQRLSLAYHDSKGTADSLYRIQYDTMSTRTFLIDNVSSILSSFITLIAMTAVMFYINWHFAIVALCVMPPLAVLIRMSSTRLKKGWVEVKNIQSRAMSVVDEVLNSLRVVKAFGRENNEGERFATHADQAVKGEVKMARTGAVYSLLVGMLIAIANALFIYFGANLVKSGAMSIGELTLVLAYLAQIFSPLEKISKNINAVQASLTSIERIFTVLDNELEVKESEHPVHLNTLKGSITFQNVSFFYNKERQILNDISFTINPGDRVGIMGSTGAGKSTLINLITRFYDPSSGTILADGTDIRNYRLEDYRRQFGIVLQEPVLFSSSIEENIAYGKPECTSKEIMEAARLANAHDFIARSKDGYDTLVGQRGMQLSGGERQRISIARAFIKNAPILILDEPTSSLDIRTEAQIMEAMERLMEGRTTFLITHRLDTLKTCNIIIHLESGKISQIISNANPEFFELKKNELLNSFNTP